MAELDCQQMTLELALTFLDVLEVFRLVTEPRRELKMNGGEFTRAPERLDRGPESRPQLVCELEWQILVLEVSRCLRTKSLGDIRRKCSWRSLVTRKKSKGLDVERKVLWRAFRP